MFFIISIVMKKKLKVKFKNLTQKGVNGRELCANHYRSGLPVNQCYLGRLTRGHAVRSLWSLTQITFDKLLILLSYWL